MKANRVKINIHDSQRVGEEIAQLVIKEVRQHDVQDLNVLLGVIAAGLLKTTPWALYPKNGPVTGRRTR